MFFRMACEFEKKGELFVTICTEKKFEKITVTFVIMFLEGSCANYENVK